jgi:hypothetical protein
VRVHERVAYEWHWRSMHILAYLGAAFVVSSEERSAHAQPPISFTQHSVSKKVGRGQRGQGGGRDAAAPAQLLIVGRPRPLPLAIAGAVAS